MSENQPANLKRNLDRSPLRPAIDRLVTPLMKGSNGIEALSGRHNRFSGTTVNRLVSFSRGLFGVSSQENAIQRLVSRYRSFNASANPLSKIYRMRLQPKPMIDTGDTFAGNDFYGDYDAPDYATEAADYASVAASESLAFTIPAPVYRQNPATSNGTSPNLANPNGSSPNGINPNPLAVLPTQYNYQFNPTGSGDTVANTAGQALSPMARAVQRLTTPDMVSAFDGDKPLNVMSEPVVGQILPDPTDPLVAPVNNYSSPAMAANTAATSSYASAVPLTPRLLPAQSIVSRLPALRHNPGIAPQPAITPVASSPAPIYRSAALAVSQNGNFPASLQSGEGVVAPLNPVAPEVNQEVAALPLTLPNITAPTSPVSREAVNEASRDVVSPLAASESSAVTQIMPNPVVIAENGAVPVSQTDTFATDETRARLEEFRGSSNISADSNLPADAEIIKPATSPVPVSPLIYRQPEVITRIIENGATPEVASPTQFATHQSDSGAIASLPENSSQSGLTLDAAVPLVEPSNPVSVSADSETRERIERLANLPTDSGITAPPSIGSHAPALEANAPDFTSPPMVLRQPEMAPSNQPASSNSIAPVNLELASATVISNQATPASNVTLPLVTQSSNVTGSTAFPTSYAAQPIDINAAPLVNTDHETRTRLNRYTSQLETTVNRLVEGANGNPPEGGLTSTIPTPEVVQRNNNFAAPTAGATLDGGWSPLNPIPALPALAYRKAQDIAPAVANNVTISDYTPGLPIPEMGIQRLPQTDTGMYSLADLAQAFSQQFQVGNYATDAVNVPPNSQAAVIHRMPDFLPASGSPLASLQPAASPQSQADNGSGMDSVDSDYGNLAINNPYNLANSAFLSQPSANVGNFVERLPSLRANPGMIMRWLENQSTDSTDGNWQTVLRTLLQPGVASSPTLPVAPLARQLANANVTPTLPGIATPAISQNQTSIVDASAELDFASPADFAAATSASYQPLTADYADSGLVFRQPAAQIVGTNANESNGAVTAPASFASPSPEPRFSEPTGAIGVVGNFQPLAGIQRKALVGNSEANSTDLPPVHSILRTSISQPLTSGVVQRMGEIMGNRFDHVRVHADDAAAEYVQRLGAEAVTVGSNILFGRGMYQPDTVAGQALIGHELTHVIQQANLPSLGLGRIPEVSSQGRALEAQAQATEQAVLMHLSQSNHNNSTSSGTTSSLPNPNVSSSSSSASVQRSIEAEIARLYESSSLGGGMEAPRVHLNSVTAPQTSQVSRAIEIDEIQVPATSNNSEPTGGDSGMKFYQETLRDEIFRDVLQKIREQLMIDRERFGGYHGRYY